MGFASSFSVAAAARHCCCGRCCCWATLRCLARVSCDDILAMGLRLTARRPAVNRGDESAPAEHDMGSSSGEAQTGESTLLAMPSKPFCCCNAMKDVGYRSGTKTPLARHPQPRICGPCAARDRCGILRAGGSRGAGRPQIHFHPNFRTSLKVLKLARLRNK